MGFALAPSALAEGYRLEAHESVGSTNALALKRLSEGDPGRLWVVTDRQLSGRGRRGRPWETPPGNLAATLAMVTGAGLGVAATLGFVAGLALSDALTRVAPGHAVAIAVDGAGEGAARRFELKWPNDVVSGGAKLAGILLESVLQPGGAGLAIGIGVNVVSHPEGTPYRATSLSALGASVDAPALFMALSEAWVANYRIWDGGRGVEAIRRLWLDRAAGLGGEVAVRIDRKVVRGVFETIDEDCSFVIRAPDGERVRIAAGDVHFGTVASASV